MKFYRLVLALAVTPLMGATAFAQEYVQGYFRSDGTYVQGYWRSSPDDTVTNNYSFEGNVNPFTGAVGTDTYSHDMTSPYYTGPDDNGNIGHDDDSDDNADNDDGSGGSDDDSDDGQ